MKKLGVFGGTFDPPHIGHQILAAEAAAQLKLDQVLWVLTPDPPHKQDLKFAPVVARRAMVTAAIANNTTFELSSVDIDRKGPHYAYDTVRLIAAQYPGTEISYLIGEDSLFDLPSWHRPHDFVSVCDEFGVMRRSVHLLQYEQLEDTFPGIRAKIYYLDTPVIHISSSLIRERIAAGDQFRYFLPEGVYQEINERNLYVGTQAR